MQRLSGMDATFLYTETPTSHMHVAMTGIYDTSTMPGGYSFEAFKAHIGERLHLIPPLRRRLVEVPLQIHHPLWIDDPHFDIDAHVFRVGAAPPGGRRELADIAGRIASRPLDRHRPLWEIWVVEGLKHDRVGFIAKIHHAAVDGVSGAEIMTELYDLVPEGRDIEAPDDLPTDEVPSDGELVAHALVSRVRQAAGFFPLAGRTVDSVAHLVQNRRDPAGHVGAVPLTAPRTPWNHAITSRRSVSFARIALEDAKLIKNAFGVTVNDVVLAVIAGALRNYLDSRGELPDEPLIATCPISVRTEDERGDLGNRVSAMFAEMATHVDDPVARLRAISESTVGAKAEHNALGAHMLTDWVEFAAPRTFALAARLYSSLSMAERHRPIHNLVVSNVPGPPFPLYLAGARLVAAYPMGPIMEGAGLNATVLSYEGHIDFGFMACPDLVPDVWDIATAIPAAADELVAAASPPKKQPARKKQPAKKQPAKKQPAKKQPARKKQPAKKQPARKKPTTENMF